MTLKWSSQYAPIDGDFSNVSILLLGEGANGSTTITDSSGSPKTVTAVGNAQISTAQSKFGGSSIAFDGTGDHLDVGSNSAFGYGLNDFTIEFWIYRNALNGLQVLLDHRTGVSLRVAPTIYIVSGAIRYYTNGNNRITGGTVASTQWVHVALSRSGSSTKLFLNGVQTGSTYTDINNYIDSPVRVGGANDGSSVASLTGYIDDLRITKGVARYTANFTPPPAPLVPQHIILQSPASNDPLLDLNTQPSLDLQFATGKTLDDRVSGNNLITFSRADATTCATYVDSNGVIQTAAANVPRFDHDPVTGESLGLLIEESRTNFTYPSIVPSSTLYGTLFVDGASVTENAGTAPDGTTTASLVESAQGTGNNRIYNFVGGTIRDETYSWFIKASSSDAVFRVLLSGVMTPGGDITYTFSTGSVGGSFSGNVLVEPYGNGWFRLSFTSEVGITFTNSAYWSIYGFTGDFFVWVVQREAGSFPTSIIPTTSSAVTRAADVASITGTNFSSWYNQSEGTVFAEYDGLKEYARVLYLNTNKTLITSRATINQAYDGATSLASTADLGLTLGDTRKSVTAYSGTTTTVTISGLVPVTGSPDFTSTTNTGIYLGGQGGSSNVLNGHISRLAYYPYRLADATLQEITS